MNEHIKSEIDKYSELSLKMIPGDHHRIMKTGWFGSLWIVKTAKRGFRVETTGDVGTNLNPQIRQFLGRDYDRQTTKGYKIWFVEDIYAVRKIIQIYAEM